MKEANTRAIDLWLADSDLTLIKETQISEGCVNKSDAARHLIRIGGVFIHTLQAVKNDPEELKKAMMKVDDMRRNETLANWMQSLQKDQLSAVIEMAKLIHDGKWIQTDLVSYETVNTIEI